MRAPVKCPHCGTELSNLAFSWGKKQWLWMLPCMILMLFPMWRLYKPKDDFHEDLVVKVLESRKEGTSIEVIGTVQNNGKVSWENIKVEAEFFDADGKFVDEASELLSGSVNPGELDHFKIKILHASEEIMTENVRMELKVADAFTSPF